MNNEPQAQIAQKTKKHLERIYARCVDAISDEIRNTKSLLETYPDIGPINLSETRERHVQHVILAGIRNAGYYAQAETMYFDAGSNARRIDIGAWVPDVGRWFFLEVKPCATYRGYKNVLGDAKKLLRDEKISPDKDNNLRGIIVYGFCDEVKKREKFKTKYDTISNELCADELGFEEIELGPHVLSTPADNYLQIGLWARGMTLV